MLTTGDLTCPTEMSGRIAQLVSLQDGQYRDCDLPTKFEAGNPEEDLRDAEVGAGLGTP
jgi:hypothetical protein